ncbi:hypothetical protein HK101_007312 [Irineochytrium annulatum]|nr:hypothetical protein HK101_007312 [Irineochytrium annulatum]
MVYNKNNKSTGSTVNAVQATVNQGAQAAAAKQNVTAPKTQQADAKAPKQQPAAPKQQGGQVFLGPQNGGWFNQNPGAATMNANAKVQQTSTPKASTAKAAPQSAASKPSAAQAGKPVAQPAKAAAPQHQQAKVVPQQQQAKVAPQQAKIAPQQAKAASLVKQQAAASPAPVVKASPTKAVKKFVPQGMHLKATGRNALVVYCSLKTQVNHWARMNKVASRAPSANKKGKVQQKAQSQPVKVQAKVQPTASKPPMMQKQASQTKVPVNPKPVARPVRATRLDDNSVTQAEINTFVANLFKDDAPKSKTGKTQPVAAKVQPVTQPAARKAATATKPEPVRQASAAKIQQQAAAAPAPVTKGSRQGSAKKTAVKKFVPQGMHLKATDRNAVVVFRSLRTQVGQWAQRQNRSRSRSASVAKKANTQVKPQPQKANVKVPLQKQASQTSTVLKPAAPAQKQASQTTTKGAAPKTAPAKVAATKVAASTVAATKVAAPKVAAGKVQAPASASPRDSSSTTRADIDAFVANLFGERTASIKSRAARIKARDIAKKQHREKVAMQKRAHYNANKTKMTKRRKNSPGMYENNCMPEIFTTLPASWMAAMRPLSPPHRAKVQPVKKAAMPMKPEPVVRQASATKVAPKSTVKPEPVARQASATKVTATTAAPIAKGPAKKVIKKFVPQGMHLKATNRNAMVVYRTLRSQVNQWASQERGRPLPGSPTKKNQKRDHAPLKSVNSQLPRQDSSKSIHLQSAPTTSQKTQSAPTPQPQRNAGPVKQASQAKMAAPVKQASQTKMTAPVKQASQTKMAAPAPKKASSRQASDLSDVFSGLAEVSISAKGKSAPAPVATTSDAYEMWADFWEPASPAKKEYTEEKERKLATSTSPIKQQAATKPVSAQSKKEPAVTTAPAATQVKKANTVTVTETRQRQQSAPKGANRPYLSAIPCRDMVSPYCEGSSAAMMPKF